MSIKSSFGVDKAKQFSTLPVGWWGQNRAVGKGGGGQSHPYFGRNKSKQNGLDFYLPPYFQTYLRPWFEILVLKGIRLMSTLLFVLKRLVGIV